MCRKFQEGDPSRKRFIHIVKDYQDFSAITFFFRRKHVNVYLKGGDEDIFSKLLEKLPHSIQSKLEVGGTWYSIQMTTEEEFREFC